MIRRSTAEALEAFERIMYMMWRPIVNWAEDIFHLHRVNEAVWRWQDRRRAVELDKIASLADSAGLPDSAAKAREAAVRLRAGEKAPGK